MSVALPISLSPTTVNTEVDLVRRAVRGDRQSFDELYRRHAAPAWRLATAVAGDAGQAVEAVGEGFVRALRASRRRDAADTLRTQVLAGVYRTVLDQVRAGPPTAGPTGASGAGITLLQTSFQSLPERWRAAVWLAEVEGVDPIRSGAILGTSPLVAAQLAERGRRGLATRLAQSGQSLPAALGPVLGHLADSVPARLSGTVSARWDRAVVKDPSVRLAPVTAWMGDRAPRTLGLAAGGLFALSLIGLGVLSQTTAGTGHSQLGDLGAPGASGRIVAAAGSSHGAPGRAGSTARTGAAARAGSGGSEAIVPGSAGLTTASAGRAVLTSAVLDHLTTATGGTTTVAASTGPTASGGASASGTGTGTVTRTGHGTSTGSTSTTTHHHSGTTGSGGTHHKPKPKPKPTPTPTPTPAPAPVGGTGGTPVVTVPGVVNVNTGSGGTTVAVGSPTQPVAKVTTCANGAGVSVLGVGVDLGCSTTTPSSGTGSSGAGSTSGGSSGSGSSGSGSALGGSGSGGSGSGGSGSSGSSGSGSSGSGSSGSGSGSGSSGSGKGSGGSGSGSGGSGSGGSGSGGSCGSGSGSGGSGSGGSSSSGGSGSGSSGSGGLLGGLGGILGI
jgi:DNA-directed RNA polymerase specialized sigma24 family protein